MAEYIITIKRGTRAETGDNGPLRGFGRRRYLARRLRPGTCPVFQTSYDTFTQIAGITDSYDYYYNDDGRVPGADPHTFAYSVRNGDLLMFVMRIDGTAEVAGWSYRDVGVFRIFWKFYRDGDPLEATVTVSGTSYDPADPTAYDSSYYDAFWLPVRGVKESADPFAASAALSGSGASVTFPSVTAASDGDLLVNVVFHESDQVTVGEYFSGATSSGAPDVTEYQNFASGAIRENIPGTYGLLLGTVAKKGATGATVATAPASAAWSSISIALPRIAPAPASPVCGEATGPDTARMQIKAFKGDIVLWCGYDASPGDGWTLLPGYPDSSSGYIYRVWWKRWTDSDVPNWPDNPDIYNPDTDPQIVVVKNATTASSPFRSVAVSGGNSPTATTPVATGSKGDLAVVITHGRNLPMKFRYNEAQLERFENQKASNSYVTLASGYVGSSGAVPSFTASGTTASARPWVSSVIVMRKR